VSRLEKQSNETAAQPTGLNYDTLHAEGRLRINEIWRGPFQEALAEYLAAKEAEGLVAAAPQLAIAA
jgi:hypothetical protein